LADDHGFGQLRFVHPLERNLGRNLMNQTKEASLFQRVVSGIEKKSRNQVFLVLLVAVAILFVRKTDSFIHPQFWAEDGAVFFQDQVNQGASAIFKPYAGYLNLVPRLIAVVADAFFPYSAAPAVYNYASLLVMLVVIFNVYSPRFIVDNKLLLSLAIVLVPHFGNEVFMNVANVNWILAILLLVVLFKEEPGRRFGNVGRQVASDAVAMVCCGFSGPFIIFLTPFFVWRLFARKSRYNSCLAAAAVLIAAIQSVFLSRDASLMSGTSQTDASFVDYCSVAGQKIFGNLFLGGILPYHLNPYLLCGSGVLVVASVVCLAMKSGKERQIFVFLAFSAMIVLATFLKFKRFPYLLLPQENGPRYFYVPYVMFTWALILCLNKQKKSENGVVCLLLGAILFSSITSGFHSQPLKNFNWDQSSRLVVKNRNAIIPINPPGWQVNVTSRK
jgi:hypothetical protein